MIGTSGDYEKPKNPNMIVDTSKENLKQIINRIIKKIL